VRLHAARASIQVLNENDGPPSGTPGA
jgi:hypothetical protein